MLRYIQKLPRQIKKEGEIQGFHPIFGFWVKILYSRPEP